MKVALIHVVEARSLQDPEYRAGDLTAGLFSKVTGSVRNLKPYTLGQLEGMDDYVETQVASASADGNAEFGETLVLMIPDMRKPQLVLEVRDSVGPRDIIRGDPLYGRCTIDLNEQPSHQPTTLDLERNGKAYGRLIIHITISHRVARDVVLGKTALLPFPIVGAKVGTHWGIIIQAADDGTEIYEMIATGTDAQEFGIVGPRGLIANNVPDPIWDEWKDTISRNRSTQGFLPMEATQYLDQQGTIPTEEFKRLVVPRPLDGFEAMKETVGSTFRNSDEIEGFIVWWTSAHPGYAWDCNCQTFAKDLFRFLSCGHSLNKVSLSEAIKFIGAPVIGAVAVALVGT